LRLARRHGVREHWSQADQSEQLTGNRTLTWGTICNPLVFNEKKITDVETPAAFADVQGEETASELISKKDRDGD